MSEDQRTDFLLNDDEHIYGWTQMDNGVIYCKGISDSEFKTYAVIRSLVNSHKKVAWPSYDTIAELSGHSKRTAMRNVASLEEKDLIKRISRSGTSNHFIVKKVQNSTVLRNEQDIADWKNERSAIEENAKPQQKPPAPGEEQKKADPIPYKEIIEHLNIKANKKFLHTTEKHRKDIRARYNEMKKAGMEHDIILGEFARVIDVMSNNWTGKTFNGTPAEKYLQPSTLFGGKFDRYRQEEFENKQTGQASSDDRFSAFLNSDD